MAVLKLLVLSLAVLYATAAQESTQEEPPAGEKEQTLTKCKGDSVAFPWKSNTSADQHVVSVQWTYENASTSQIIAVFGNEQFNPGQPYKNRVLHVPDEGLVLKDLKTWDAGRYSTEVTGFDTSGLPSSRRSSTILTVADGFLKLSTLDEGKLHLSLEPEAVWDSGLKQWNIRLTCGHFTAARRPPFDVTWETPSGTILNSTTYADGKFILSLTAPFSEGAYSCRVPAELVHHACKFSSKKPVTDIVARLILNADTARMALMEARQKKEMAELKRHNAALTSQLRDLKETAQSTTKALSDRLESVSNVTHHLEGTVIAMLEARQKKEVAELRQDNVALTSQLRDLKETMENTRKSAADATDRGMKALSHRLDSITNVTRHIEGVTKRKVAFNAMLAKGRAANLKNLQTIVLTEVTLNEGGAYSAHTGIFTALMPGIYCFIALSSPMLNGNSVSMVLIVDGKPLAYTYAHREGAFQSASIHSVLSLGKGQRVWLASNGNSYFRDNHRTVFSGFLINAN